MAFAVPYKIMGEVKTDAKGSEKRLWGSLPERELMEVQRATTKKISEWAKIQTELDGDFDLRIKGAKQNPHELRTR